MLESLFNKIPCLQACNFFKKRLQHRCFLVKFAKLLRTPILKKICERLLCISYDLHEYVSLVWKNCQRTWTKFINYLQGFHVIAIWGHSKSTSAWNFQFLTPLSPNCLFLFVLHAPPPSTYIHFIESSPTHPPPQSPPLPSQKKFRNAYDAYFE